MAALPARRKRVGMDEASAPAQAPGALSDVFLAPEHIEHVIRARREALVSLRADIGTALYDALCAKVEYERSALLALAEYEARIAREREQSAAILPHDYFALEPLGEHII